MPLAKIEGNQIYAFKKGVHSEYDAFDKSQPDLFVCKASILNNAAIKNILERPQLKILIVNDCDDNVSWLKSQIGDNFLAISDEAYCSLDNCLNARPVQEFRTTVICPEGAIFQDIQNWNFTEAKIFSSLRVINHKFFCGFISPEMKYSTFASSEYALVSSDDKYNVAACGSKPTFNEKFNLYTDLSREEIINNHTNYDFCKLFLLELSYREEANYIEKIKNESLKNQ